jgi:diguanylate cyclase (GGDEF)-like protein
VSAINAVLCGAAAWELTSGRSEDLPSRRPLMLVFASFATLMVVRVAIAPLAPFPMGAGVADPLWVAGFVLLVFIHTAFAAQLFFSLTRERREAQQRSFALSDQLTGLMNRRAFSDYSERTAGPAYEGSAAMALLVLDLDHFKSVNDRHGHEAGDRLLQAFAEVARVSVRPSDQLFRMGGEEFCFVLPAAGAKEAVAIAERIRAAFEATSVETRYGRAQATVSIGIAAAELPVSADVLLSTADAAVYEAKARGRNRVVLADPSALVDVVRAGAALTRRRA